MNASGTVMAFGLALALATGPVRAAGAFHPPQTATEKELDRMLNVADADQDQLDNLLDRPGSRHTVDYATILTSKLIVVMRQAEKRQVAKECGGHYRDGDLCGMDSSPITCGQDSAPAYIYHTILDLGAQVVIEYAGAGDSKRIATYTLVQAKSGWRIDGVSCAAGPTFN